MRTPIENEEESASRDAVLAALAEVERAIEETRRHALQLFAERGGKASLRNGVLTIVAPRANGASNAILAAGWRINVPR